MKRTTEWKTGPSRPALGCSEVHVWRASLEWPEEIHQRLRATIDRSERERAARFASERLRRRYVAGRGILRLLLASYLDRDPATIEFRYGEHDKPFLTGDDNRSDLEFNVSHSRDLALFAFARGRSIGIDLEWVRDDLEQAEIASRFFSSAESTTLLSLSPAEQIERFFALWTAKEAFVKARGAGVFFGLDRFDVRLEPGRPIAEIVCNQPRQSFAPWYAFTLEPAVGFVGALAVQRSDIAISRWEWSGQEWLPSSAPAAPTPGSR